MPPAEAQLADSGLTILGIAGAITILSIAATWIGKWVRGIWRSGKAVYARWERIDTGVTNLLHDMDLVKKEVRYNGGSSMKDVVRELRHDIAIERAARRLIDTRASYELRAIGEHFVPVFVTPAFTELTGITKEESERLGWTRAIAEEFRDEVTQRAIECTRSGRVFSAHYINCHVRTGALTDVLHVATPITDRDGMVIGWIGLITPMSLVQ